MLKTISVDLTIRNNESGTYLRIPVLPETIPYKDGSAIKDTVKILDLGNVNFHSGVDLDEFTIESFFPAEYDAGYCTTSELLTTEQYRNTFSNWKDGSTSLQIICPAAYINKNMELTDFEWEFAGADLDLYYKATFKEKKDIKPYKIAVQAATNGIVTQAVPTPGPENRPPIPEQLKPAKVIVQPGDSLCRIAKALPPTVTWDQLYATNKSIIGANPNLIYPGQELEVPV